MMGSFLLVKAYRVQERDDPVFRQRLFASFSCGVFCCQGDYFFNVSVNVFGLFDLKLRLKLGTTSQLGESKYIHHLC
jgi:hypothetical protein